MNGKELIEKIKNIITKILRWVRMEPKKAAITIVAGVFIVSFISVLIKGPSEVPEDNKVVVDEKSEEEKRIEKEEKEKAKEEREKKREEVREKQAEEEKEQAEKDRIAQEENPQKFFEDKAQSAYDLTVTPSTGTKEKYSIRVKGESFGVIEYGGYDKVKIQDSKDNLIAYMKTINNGNPQIYDNNDKLIGYIKSNSSSDNKKVLEFLNESRNKKGHIELMRTVEKDKYNQYGYNEYNVYGGYQLEYVIKEKEGNKYEITSKASDPSVKAVELMFAIRNMSK